MQGCSCLSTNLCCDVHHIAYTSGLGEGNPVHATSQEVTPSPHSAGCNVGTLLHPAHHLPKHCMIVKH